MAMYFMFPALFLAAYFLWLIVYRLFFSPIRHIPGSKLTAATGWYETYYDVVQGGQFTFKIQEWHKYYGPIIRINPTEVHICDPDFYDTIYTSSAPFDKLKEWKYRFGLPDSVHATVEHDLHHHRRIALNPYFSKRQIYFLAPYIQERATKLANRLANEYRSSTKPVVMNDAWATYTADVVTYYCFAWSWDFVGYPDFVAPFTATTTSLASLAHISWHFAWLNLFFQSLPDMVLGVVYPTMKPIIDLQQAVEKQVISIKSGSNIAQKDLAHRTIFHSLLTSNLPPQELEVDRLRQEGSSIVGAGVETTKSTLTLATFYILKNPKYLQRLRKELKQVFPDPNKPPELSELEQLPFLTATIRESLRLSGGVAQRLPRISRTPIQYSTYTIPHGVPISMSAYIQHRDERIFPSSKTFNPDRWIDPTEERHLSRYLVSFSKGTRMCLGVNLAWAEMYIGLATIFRRVELELFETESDAVDMGREYFVPLPKKGSKGVRVLVK